MRFQLCRWNREDFPWDISVRFGERSVYFEHWWTEDHVKYGAPVRFNYTGVNWSVLIGARSQAWFPFFDYERRVYLPVTIHPRGKRKEPSIRRYRQRHPTQYVTRFEVINEGGRIVVANDVRVELSYQDDYRTLKVFLRKPRRRFVREAVEQEET